MPPPIRHQGQKQIQRPLQAELATLNNLLTGGILEHSARILDHFASTQNSKLESESYATPSFLTEKLLDKCNEFETVCDQIYYILEQSKRVLQLDWQQRNATQDQAQQQQQQHQQQQQQQQNQQEQHMATDDMGTDLSVTQNVDLNLDDMDDMDNGGQQPSSTMEPMDEDDMDELLQIQRERLERLRNVIVHGVDVESLKDSQGNGKDDLLF